MTRSLMFATIAILFWNHWRRGRRASSRASWMPSRRSIVGSRQGPTSSGVDAFANDTVVAILAGRARHTRRGARHARRRPTVLARRRATVLAGGWATILGRAAAGAVLLWGAGCGEDA